MARAALIAVLLAGCGLASKDYDVVQPFQAGGAPSFTHGFDSSSLAGPLSADVSKISSITLKAARIEETDGDPAGISFISGATITVSGTTIATLPAPPAAGQTSVQLQTTGTELKPFIQSGSLLQATISYSPTPVTARSLQLVLTLHGSLF